MTSLWLHEGIRVDDIDSQYCGFVYIIKNLQTNKKYIGKKLLKFKKTKIIKGKKKKYTVDSDWRDYWGSNDELKEDVKVYGELNFRKEILRFCKTKGELSYWEAKYQFEFDVLLKPKEFYNGWIFVKVRRVHLGANAMLDKKEFME